MLRVSSLGLRRYHDASFFVLRSNARPLRSAASSLARSASTETNDGQTSDSTHRPAPSPAEGELAARSPRVGRVRPEDIPPLQYATKLAALSDDASSRTASSDWEARDSPPHIHTRERCPPAGDGDDTMAPQERVPLNRADLEYIVATTTSLEDAWEAYQQLRTLTRPQEGPLMSFAHLHRLARLIASNPRTRANFLRLLSVLSAIHRSSGSVQLWQWNALIDFAGKGWRKTRLEDFKAALDVYDDMVSGRSPGSSWGTFEDETLPLEAVSLPLDEKVIPDVVTFTTLINIAANTGRDDAMRRAIASMRNAGVEPNRITHLALIKFHTNKNQLADVRSILAQMMERGFDLGVDGVNAVIWAYGRAGRLDIASAVYRVIHRWASPENDLAEEEIAALMNHLRSSENIDLSQHVFPTATTYHTMIQCYAYHGDLIRCLQVFTDMLATPDRTTLQLTNDSSESRSGEPSLPAFRAIFLGFARHGQANAALEDAGPLTRRLQVSAWTLENLEVLFKNFLKLPPHVTPSERTIFWVLIAFMKTSGDDARTLRWVWDRLVERFGGAGWGGRLERFRRRLFDSRQK